MSTRYLFGANPHLLEHARRVQSEKGLGKSAVVVDLHIRYGLPIFNSGKMRSKMSVHKEAKGGNDDIMKRTGIDKVPEAQRVPLAVYVRETRRLLDKLGAHMVFVASDNHAAVAKFSRLLYADWGGEQLKVMSQGEDSRENPMQALLTDLVLLG